MRRLHSAAMIAIVAMAASTPARAQDLATVAFECASLGMNSAPVSPPFADAERLFQLGYTELIFYVENLATTNPDGWAAILGPGVFLRDLPPDFFVGGVFAAAANRIRDQLQEAVPNDPTVPYEVLQAQRQRVAEIEFGLRSCALIGI